MEKSSISLVIANDHPLMLAGLAALVKLTPGFELLGQAISADDTVACYTALQPDILLVDLDIPGGGIEAVSRIRGQYPDAKVVVLTGHDGDECVHRALSAGASACLLKQAGFDEIVHCMRQVANNRRYLPPRLAEKLASRIHTSALSRRELDILAHLSTGKSNKVIARDAGIGVGTVKYHVNNILSKLNVTCRTEAAYVGRERGLLHSY
jgi:DNA-binding NarL/FixJ family response regulator